MKSIARCMVPLLLAGASELLHAQANDPMVLRTVTGPANSFITYPHNNGFWRSDTVNWGTDTMVIATDLGSGNYQFSQFDPNTSHLATIGQYPFQAPVYFWDVARNGTAVVTDNNSQAVKWDLRTDTKTVLWSSSTDRVIGDVITPDGKTVAFSTQLIGSNGLDCSLHTLDVATLAEQTRVHKTNFNLNHVHFSPFDNSWIQFSHEGDPTVIRDRMWGWNALQAPSPNGANIFPAAGPLLLQNDHERAMFNKAGSMVVAYGGNANSGVWEADYDGTYNHTSTNQLGYDANHVNISHDGRWLVVDTTNVGGVSHVVAINFATGVWRALYTTSIQNHPWHPHPAISPDSRWVFFNDYNLKKVVAIEIDPAQLATFLGGVPAAPPELAATAGSGAGKIDLTWAGSSGAASYKVKRALASGGPYTTIASNVTDTSYSDTGVTASTTYYYVVSAVNGTGESPNSTQVNATAAASTAWVTGQTLGTLRNDISNWVGCRFSVGSAPLTVSDLGRWVVAGNSGTHTVKLVKQVDGTDVPGGSVTVDTSSAPAGAFNYVALAQPVTLSANSLYYLVSQETAGGDRWYNYDTTVTTTSVASMNKAARFDGASWLISGTSAQMTYGPCGFRY